MPTGHRRGTHKHTTRCLRIEPLEDRLPLSSSPGTFSPALLYESPDNQTALMADYRHDGDSTATSETAEPVDAQPADNDTAAYSEPNTANDPMEPVQPAPEPMPAEYPPEYKFRHHRQPPISGGNNLPPPQEITPPDNADSGEAPDLVEAEETAPLEEELEPVDPVEPSEPPPFHPRVAPAPGDPADFGAFDGHVPPGVFEPALDPQLVQFLNRDGQEYVREDASNSVTDTDLISESSYGAGSIVEIYASAAEGAIGKGISATGQAAAVEAEAAEEVIPEPSVAAAGSAGLLPQLSELLSNHLPVDLQALEIGAEKFLAEIDNLVDAATPEGAGLYSWMTAAVTAAVAFEIARRQRRFSHQGLLLVPAGTGRAWSWSNGPDDQPMPG